MKVASLLLSTINYLASQITIPINRSLRSYKQFAEKTPEECGKSEFRSYSTELTKLSSMQYNQICTRLKFNFDPSAQKYRRRVYVCFRSAKAENNFESTEFAGIFFYLSPN